MSTAVPISRDSKSVALGLALVVSLTVSGCSVDEDPEDDVVETDSSSELDATDDQVDVEEVLDTAISDNGDTTVQVDGDTREPTLPGCVIVEDFTVVPFDDLARYDRIGIRGVMVFTSADEFLARLGTPPPAEIDFPREWAVLRSDRSTWYGGSAELVHLEFCPSQMFIDATLVRGGDGCELLEIDAGATTLVKFPAITSPTSSGAGGGFERTTFTCDASSPAEGAACTHGTLCQPGLLCAGLTRAESGVCVPATQQLTVTSSVDVAIADDGSTPSVATNLVGALPGVDADVIVEAHFAHARPEELTVTLVHPSGERVVLWDHEPNEGAAWGLSGVPSLYRSAVGLTGAPVAGTWQLEILDDVPGNAGELGAWTLTVVTR